MTSVRLVERLRREKGADVRRVTVLGEEPRPAYDRVKLTSWFEGRDPAKLSLGDAAWYREQGAELRVGERVVAIDRGARTATTSAGNILAWDELVLATGSAPLVPPLPGIERAGVFVYRTIEDLEAIAAHAGRARRCAVLGGGLLGLEAARAALDLGVGEVQLGADERRHRGILDPHREGEIEIEEGRQQRGQVPGRPEAPTPRLGLAHEDRFYRCGISKPHAQAKKCKKLAFPARNAHLRFSSVSRHTGFTPPSIPEFPPWKRR